MWPQIDLIASGFFYRAGQGFFIADTPIFIALHWLAYYGARFLGVSFALLAVATYIKKKRQGKTTVLLSLDAKAWFFLLLALIIAPGLVANAGFKDHWGRARPREVAELGGTVPFTPFYAPQFHGAHSNGSFVSGDGAFGFFLPAFAFVAPLRSSRRVFWSMMGAGAVFGFVRLAMGAHFFSDIVYAAFFMLATISCVHAAMYGRHETAARWREWFGRACGSNTSTP